MPILNPNKCYAQQPKTLVITAPESLPAKWLTDFYELLAVQLKLDDDKTTHEVFNHQTNQVDLLTKKEIFFKELNRHAGENSGYSKKSQLLESLSTLYAIFTHPKTSNEQKSLIALRIAEDVKECSPGFHDRVNYVIILFNMPQNLAQLVAQARFKLADRIAGILASKSAQGVHVHNRVIQVAHEAGFGVWPINTNDLYYSTGSSDLSDADIIKRLQTGFDNHFQLFALLNALCEQIEVLIAVHGYQGKRGLGNAYEKEAYEKFCECCNRFIPREMEELLEIDTTSGKVIDLNWRHVKRALLQQLIDEDYVSLSQEDVVSILNEDAKTLISLISNHYELAACLQFFSEWSLEQKATFVLSYLHSKSPSAQKEILTILHNEAPQLTAQLKTEPRLQAMYFEIAIAEKDIAAVRTYVEAGADINAALKVLFNEEHKRDTLYWLHEQPVLLQKLTATGMNTVIGQGKYQGKTVAETLVSTKKGRQLVLENNTLQTLLSETTIANTFSDHLQQAQTERNTANTAVGFFKKSDPLAIQLVQSIVYGDLKKSEDLLKANPLLLRTLLTEKVTVKDYSRRKVKQTAFQAALCAMDDELCEMLANYLTQEEMNSQYQVIFPAGHEAYYSAQTAFDFSQIVNTISDSIPADVDKALSLELPNNTALWVALEQFRVDFTKRSNQEVVFNPQHLIKAFELYDKKYDNWTSKQQDLFWRQVIGYVQRFLPANIAMDFAQGLYARVENKEKSNRSFNFTYGGGSIFPLSLDSSLAGLGYNYAAARVWRWWGSAGRFVASSFKSCVKQKQQSWENYAARVARQSSDLLFNSVK
jgi:hypothetical protein